MFRGAPVFKTVDTTTAEAREGGCEWTMSARTARDVSTTVDVQYCSREAISRLDELAPESVFIDSTDLESKRSQLCPRRWGTEDAPRASRQLLRGSPCAATHESAHVPVCNTELNRRRHVTAIAVAAV